MVNLERFLNKINLQLCEHHKSILLDTVEIITFQKQDTILFEGENASCLYYIVSGMVRGYYLDRNGNEYTKCFSAENEYFCTECLRTKKESTFSIQCMEEVTCLKIPYQSIEQICKEDRVVDKFIASCYTLEVTKLEHRQKFLLIHDATERYNQFCEIFPQLYSRIPLMYIASYIGIRPASLSRIRKNKA